IRSRIATVASRAAYPKTSISIRGIVPRCRARAAGRGAFAAGRDPSAGFVRSIEYLRNGTTRTYSVRRMRGDLPVGLSLHIHLAYLGAIAAIVAACSRNGETPSADPPVDPTPDAVAGCDPSDLACVCADGG